MGIVNFGTMILDGPGGYMIGHCFRNLKLEKKTMRGSFLLFKFIRDVASPMRS